MRILVAINGNASEWEEGLEPTPDRPRLPLTYAFGAALVRCGAELSCIDMESPPELPRRPFIEAFPAGRLREAMSATDAAALWGALGVRAILRQAQLASPRRRVILSTYVWRDAPLEFTKARLLCVATRTAAKWARMVVVMTREQQALAKEQLSDRVPVVRLQCGVDTAFYSQPCSMSDVPWEHRQTVERLLREPYVIMPGDELRSNADAIELVSRMGLQLVRVSQYSWKSGTSKLKAQVAEKRLGDKVLVFERIDYRFLRFLLRNARAYVGLVDSSWQPAGWTVACEALSSGLPSVLYEGIVSRELVSMGADPVWLRVAPAGDVTAFASELERMIRAPRVSTDAGPAAFAKTRLNLEQTGDEFARQLVGTFHGLGAP